MRSSSVFGFASTDGAISRAEFAQAMHALGLDAPAAEVRALFDEWDADGSGEISFAELERILRQAAPPARARAPSMPKPDAQTTDAPRKKDAQKPGVPAPTASGTAISRPAAQKTGASKPAARKPSVHTATKEAHRLGLGGVRKPDRAHSAARAQPRATKPEKRHASVPASRLATRPTSSAVLTHQAARL